MGQLPPMNASNTIIDVSQASPPSGSNTNFTIADNSAGRTTLTIFPKTSDKGNGKTYILPIPKGFNDTFENTWNNVELGPIGGNVYEGMKNSGIASVTDIAEQLLLAGVQGGVSRAIGDGASEAVANIASLINKQSRNPHTHLMYKSPALRQFQFTWALKPKNIKQAEQIKQMIMEIRNISYPELSGAAIAGAGFFNYPGSFKVIIVGGKQEILLNTIDCACTSLQVNYDTQGNVYTHKDGKPVTSTITVSLQEISQLSRDIVQTLYY
jgi:hypothetical protein